MKKYRLLRMGLALVATASLAVSSGALSASAASKPRLVVTPTTNLKSGQTLSVSGSGFKPGDTVYIVECLTTAKGQSGCNVPIPPVSSTISSSGKLALTFIAVTTGKVGNGTCGTTVANAKKCDISVGNATGGDSATAVLTFKVK